MMQIAEVYKGVAIEELRPGSRPYRFNFYAIFAAGARAGTYSMEGKRWGNPEWTSATLEDARREIDRFLREAGIAEVPPVPRGRAAVAHEPDPTFAAGKARLRSLAVEAGAALYRDLSDPAAQIVRSLEDGVQWTRWRLRHQPGMFGFIHMKGLFPDWSEINKDDMDFAVYFVNSPLTEAFSDRFQGSPTRPAVVIYNDGRIQEIPDTT